MIPWSAFKVVGREKEYLSAAFESGWVSGGPFVERLEKELEARFAGSTALAVSNGTSALQLAFQILGVRPGDKVIVPSFCFQAAGNVLNQLGAKPVFCDVDVLTWNQSEQTIEEAARAASGVAGVVVVHNYGVAAPIRRIREWCDRNGVWLIEDCAESWFTRAGGRLVGLYGDVCTFSMHATKTISCGEGGAVLVNRAELVGRAQLLRSHGLDRTKTQYLHSLAGNNYRLSNILAAVACGQIECSEQICEAQRRIHAAYSRILGDHWAIRLQGRSSDGGDLLWATAVCIRFDSLRVSRDEMLTALKAHGIEARPGFYPASALAYNEGSPVMKSAVADMIHKSIIVLPCALTLTEAQIEQVCRVLIDLIDSAVIGERVCRILRVQRDEVTVADVQRFYDGLVTGRRGFRYFDKRAYEVTASHLCTLLLEVAGKLVGYGHLDPEGDDVWLGVAVADAETGKGWGRVIMQALVEEAAQRGVPGLVLRVDRDNVAAIRLYESFGFIADPGRDQTPTALTMTLHR